MDEATVRQWLWAFASQTQEHAIVLLDHQFLVQWANPAAAQILGMPAAQMTGMALHRFFTADDVSLGIPEHEIAVAISQGSSEDDRWMARADGSQFWASGRTVALSDAQGNVFGFLKILRNQTDIEMRMRTFRNQVAALEQIESARLVAFATLSHELRNPLSALNLAALALGRQAVDPALRQPLDIIQRNVRFIARMVDDLEQAMRISVGKLTLEVEPLWLHEEIDAAIHTAFGRAGNPPRHLEVLLPPGQPISLEADRLRIQQVFANMIGNAIKFTGDDGRIWVKGTVEGGHVVVRVEDDGVGIAPEMLDTIFSMFTQAERPAGQAPGLGIGLALVKTIVELHGGSVQASSEGIGKGSEFTVRLPLHQVEAAVDPMAQGASGQAGSGRESGA
jgi:two-component system CheB/CheR fusion protein